MMIQESISVVEMIVQRQQLEINNIEYNVPLKLI